jgi:hypothetical protein
LQWKKQGVGEPLAAMEKAASKQQLVCVVFAELAAATVMFGC